MGKGKLSGFLVAVILAVVSFFVIFIFFPGFSEKCFGVSMKNGDVDLTAAKEELRKSADEIMDKMVRKAAESETFKDNLKEKISRKIKSADADIEKVAEKVGQTVSSITEKPASERIDIKSLIK